VHTKGKNPVPHQVQLSHLEQTAYFAALREGLSILDVEGIGRLVPVSRSHAIKLLAAMAQKGVLHRVGRGRYVVIPSDVLYERRAFVADPFQVVDDLMVKDGCGAYYVAYQSAAFVYGAADQLPQALLVAVPRQRRPISLGQAEILFVQAQLRKFFGIEEIRYHDASLRISDREKTLLDCLDRYDLCGGVDEVSGAIAALLPEVNAGRLLGYLPRIGNQALVHRLGFMLEKLSADGTLLDGVASLVGPRVYRLDPHGPAGGSIHPRWRVRENIALSS
jgi:predicted transcriptional regulator of viral defense system